jgi:hypothetical protein
MCSIYLLNNSKGLLEVMIGSETVTKQANLDLTAEQ